MKLEFSDEQRQSQRTLRELLSREYRVRDAWQGGAREIWTRLAEVGVLGVAIPEPVGLGGGPLDWILLAEEAGRAALAAPLADAFCTPALQKPLELGADLVIHSATKYLDGQGRVLGGAVLGPRKIVTDQVFPFLRTAGPSLSPFNAWVILKGLETLELRVRAQSASALEMAAWLEKQPGVARVFYPGLRSHPQHALAMKQQQAGGAVLSFELKGGKKAAWRLIDSTELVSITGNLGDVKTTITHPASTTHGRISAEARAAAGVTDGLVRLSVGLEAVEDLKEDLARGLA